MKNLIISALLVLPGILYSQTQVNQTFDASAVRSISLNFKYPELVQVRSWDKNQLVIKGTVIINNGENDNAFKLTSVLEGDKLVINSEIENLDGLPKKITVRKNGETYVFNTDNWNDPELKQFFREHGNDHEYVSQGVHKEIKLEVFMPASMALQVNAKYGIVEILDYEAPLEVNAKYGGVDIKIPQSSRRDIQARTKYGEIFTDLEVDFDRTGSDILDYDKWTVVSKKLNGGGTKCYLESKYGNVYMRK
ncbi:hypothetical protein GCM10009122_35830 [Fulvivirga kasyanovii]|uniref:Adhesin domain-containing protein n=1 Tax=Fulvivirga kasyanovii TaxID=396812 RepID=A0ABW9RXC4_9BACT|nr:hypothetical protein [Fulvivirga kasyanovii]MTI28681.1 hypothetical protein [Fulvivirga kasyanovii]